MRTGWIKGRRAGAIGAAIVLAAAAGVVGWRHAVHWRPATDAYPLQGVDVSEATGGVDWPTVRAGGADFAYIRATRGAAGRDARFAAHWSAAYAAGMRRGAVHEFALCQSAAAQANNFIVFVPRVADALPAAVAIEESAECGTPPARSVLVAAVAQFAAMVERHTGRPVILRIAPAIEQRYLLSAALHRPLWATGGFVTPTYLSRPWRLWRANGMRQVDGADRAVGWDVVAR